MDKLSETELAETIAAELNRERPDKDTIDALVQHYLTRYPHVPHYPDMRDAKLDNRGMARCRFPLAEIRRLQALNPDADPILSKGSFGKSKWYGSNNDVDRHMALHDAFVAAAYNATSGDDVWHMLQCACMMLSVRDTAAAAIEAAEADRASQAHHDPYVLAEILAEELRR